MSKTKQVTFTSTLYTSHILQHYWFIVLNIMWSRLAGPSLLDSSMLLGFINVTWSSFFMGKEYAKFEKVIPKIKHIMIKTKVKERKKKKKQNGNQRYAQGFTIQLSFIARIVIKTVFRWRQTLTFWCNCIHRSKTHTTNTVHKFI